VKVLLDENLPHRLRHHLPQHDVYTASYAGFAGYKNGELLDAAESAGFEVLVTGDRTLHYEQNLSRRNIALVSLSSVRWQFIEPHLSTIALAVGAATPGSSTNVDVGRSRRPRKFEGPGLGS
jgi:hypothetical protein